MVLKPVYFQLAGSAKRINSAALYNNLIHKELANLHNPQYTMLVSYINNIMLIRYGEQNRANILDTLTR